jgi:FkbM family methyltransferase
MDIPIVVICHNNYKYVENTLKQILKINEKYFNNIKILDNCSNCVDTINYLKTVNCKVVHNNVNTGPWISTNCNQHIYDLLPDKFILTDPDLGFNENIPNNFIDILSTLSDTYSCNKIGFALDINDFEKMYQNNNYVNNFSRDFSIYEWEIRFWTNKIIHDTYEIYNAEIDTTFCLINKKHTNFQHIRIAGNFTAKHLPWYVNNSIYNHHDNYMLNKKTSTSISTISRIIIPYIDANYLKITKHDELFLIEKNSNNANINFWENIYTNWERDTFDIFDKFLDKNKIFIDIGGWIGTTAMYGSRKSKYVYSIEADTKSFNDMSINLKNNCKQNYTLIDKAIYNINNIELTFGKNKFLDNSKMNDSTSHIYTDNKSSSECYSIQTITLQYIIEKNNINPHEISLIKVDIEGGEENILNDLFSIHVNYNVPLYISFHFDWWNDRNLNRFEFLTEVHKKNIITSPFISILFN